MARGSERAPSQRSSGSFPPSANEAPKAALLACVGREVPGGIARTSRSVLARLSHVTPGKHKHREEATETSMHPEESVQTGILGDAQVCKETVIGQEGQTMACTCGSSAQLTPGEEMPRNDPRQCWGKQWRQLCLAREGLAGRLGSKTPRNNSGTWGEEISKDTKAVSSDPGE